MKKLFILALIIGAVLLVQRLKQERANWQGLTRGEAEEKLRGIIEPKLDGKVDGEQLDGIVGAVLDGMMSKGIVVADPRETTKSVWQPSETIDLADCVARYTRWGTDLTTVVEGGSLYRVAADGAPYRVAQLASGAIEVVSTGDIETALGEVRYRLGADLDRSAVADLGTRVPAIGRQLESKPGYRPPFNAAVLESLVASIAAQQVNLRWAATTRARLVERYGNRHELNGTTVYGFPAPATLAEANPADIRALQFTTRKSEYIVDAARAVVGGGLDGLETSSDDEVIGRITAIRGLGRWTAEWFLARTLGRSHAVAPGDLGVRKAVSRFVEKTDETLPESRVREICAGWGNGANWGMHLLLEALSQ